MASPRTFAAMGGHRRVKRTFHKGQVLRLTIEDMAFGGKGIARVETEKGPFVVFVQNAFPAKRSTRKSPNANRVTLSAGC